MCSISCGDKFCVQRILIGTAFELRFSKPFAIIELSGMKAEAEPGSVTAAAEEATALRKLRREKDVFSILLRLFEVT
jgi:hypothetical protein